MAFLCDSYQFRTAGHTGKLCLVHAAQLQKQDAATTIARSTPMVLLLTVI